MADLVVGLDKSVVEGALTKAQEAIEEEAKLRQGAKRDLVFITGEFRMMQSFLNVANEERVENKVVRTWVTQVRELAYDVEDCIELVVHLDKKTSLWLRMIPSCMAPPLPLDEALEEIEQLKARVKDVSKRNARYSLISDTDSKPVIVQQQPATGAAVGGAITTSNMLAEARDAAKRQQVLGGDLTQLITTNDDDEVISVWGAGGDHGITSIVMKTYTDAEICQNFTYRTWVKLTHPFVPHDFVLSLMAQFYASLSWKGKQERATIGMHVLTKMQVTQEDHLFEEFERIVTEERYLVVLEGLSSMVDWHSTRTFLPHGKNGSRIIVSTHQSEIATLCIGHSYQILELKQFSAEHSVCVLFNKGSSGNADKGKKPIVDSSLVGRGSQMNELHKYSAKACVSPSKVMSVWGIAGVGKSALVGDLYNDLRNKDDTRQPQEKQYKEYHWVNVSHPFNLRDFCQSLLSDFHSGKDPIEECHQLLKQNRCLVVIDDIHSKKDWELIKSSLLPRSSDSVTIVITTEASIATYCANNKELVFNVKGLEALISSNRRCVF